MNAPEVIAKIDGLWVISKPAGWVVHPAGIPEQKDLLSWARSQGAPATVAALHRLDLETSGIVVLAEDPRAHYALLKAFEDGEVEKTYLALVYGVPRAEGTINTHLDDERRGKKLPASTSYKVLEVFEGLSLVEVKPHTGRKHQIRRHFQGIGFALVGDQRYKPRKKFKVPGYPHRLWLHAARLAWNGLVFECGLPDELEQHLRVLRKGDGQLTSTSADHPTKS